MLAPCFRLGENARFRTLSARFYCTLRLLAGVKWPFSLRTFRSYNEAVLMRETFNEHWSSKSSFAARKSRSDDREEARFVCKIPAHARPDLGGNGRDTPLASHHHMQEPEFPRWSPGSVKDASPDIRLSRAVIMLRLFLRWGRRSLGCESEHP